MRTSNGVLHFLVNGVDQGPAATSIGSDVYAVIDLYGKCSQVSVVEVTSPSNSSLNQRENGKAIKFLVLEILDD